MLIHTCTAVSVQWVYQLLLETLRLNKAQNQNSELKKAKKLRRAAELFTIRDILFFGSGYREQSWSSHDTFQHYICTVNRLK